MTLVYEDKHSKLIDVFTVADVDSEKKFGQDFETEVRSLFCSCCLAEVMKLNISRDSEARFSQDFEV